ncbi:MAG TPA: hypothetical protein VN792_02915, partial [Candidatus Acidoferrales bacterium]|nr:hypothetical protein [Candidatus Acidoferrales bacterium]
MRIVRLALITAVFSYGELQMSAWLRLHRDITIGVSIATIGLIDEWVTRLLPATIEPAGQGGFAAA